LLGYVSKLWSAMFVNNIIQSIRECFESVADG